jgi:hypothetical protein
MTTAQDPPKRNKQKRRRAKKLAEWREKNAGSPETKVAAKAAPAKAVKTAAAKKATKTK